MGANLFRTVTGAAVIIIGYTSKRMSLSHSGAVDDFKSAGMPFPTIELEASIGFSSPFRTAWIRSKPNERPLLACLFCRLNVVVPRAMPLGFSFKPLSPASQTSRNEVII